MTWCACGRFTRAKGCTEQGVSLTYTLIRVLQDMLDALHSAAAWQRSFLNGAMKKGRTAQYADSAC